MSPGRSTGKLGLNSTKITRAFLSLGRSQRRYGFSPFSQVGTSSYCWYSECLKMMVSLFSLLSLSTYSCIQECKPTKKGGVYYDFRLNTRSVKSTILHFQVSHFNQNDTIYFTVDFRWGIFGSRVLYCVWMNQLNDDVVLHHVWLIMCYLVLKYNSYMFQKRPFGRSPCDPDMAFWK